MAITLTTVTDALAFLDSFDGYGMVAVSEEEQVEKLRDFALVNDYPSKEPQSIKVGGGRILIKDASAAKLNQLAAEQGWDDASVIGLLLEFIEGMEANKHLSNFLESKAEAENVDYEAYRKGLKDANT